MEIVEDSCVLWYSESYWRNFVDRDYGDNECSRHFIWALHFNFLEVVDDELKSGVSVDQIFECGNTAIHLACRDHDSVAIIEKLLEYKPNLNIRNAAMETPLVTLIRHRYFDIDLLRKFFAIGADPNIPDQTGNAPIHYLSRCESFGDDDLRSFIALFVEQNTNLNAKNHNGDTALHLAVRGGFGSFVKLLLESGARLCVENGSRSNVVRIACINKYLFPDIFDMVIKEAIALGEHRILLDKAFLEQVEEMEYLKIFEKECDEQLLELKKIQIGDSNVSLYNILTSAVHKVSKYLRNEDIRVSLKNYDTLECGIFRNRLIQRMERSFQRFEAVKSGYPYVEKVFQGLPVVCLDKIISFLSNEDLNTLEFAHDYKKKDSEI